MFYFCLWLCFKYTPIDVKQNNLISYSSAFWFSYIFYYYYVQKNNWIGIHCEKYYTSVFDFLMFIDCVYFLQQETLFVIITVLLLRGNLSNNYSYNKRTSKKNRIYITLYRNTNTIIPHRSSVVTYSIEYVFDFKLNM